MASATSRFASVVLFTVIIVVIIVVVVVSKRLEQAERNLRVHQFSAPVQHQKKKARKKERTLNWCAELVKERTPPEE